jgi:predicted dehydrogenase
VNAQRKFGFSNTCTDPEVVLGDDSIDAVFIVTRHSSHADLVCRALESNKAVFVEKPLALTGDELDRVLQTVDATGNDRVTVGFNRRFAPMLTEMRARFGATADAAMARYLVNAGSLSADSWYGNEELEGSRFVGEGGHFIDTLSWWIGADPIEVSAMGGRDTRDLHVVLRYPDGSLASVTYVTNGHRRFPKETFEVSRGGHSARLDNFKRATVWAGRRKRSRLALGSPDKGQRAEIDAVLHAVRTGGPMPIALSSLVATTRATLAVSESLATARPVRI